MTFPLQQKFPVLLNRVCKKFKNIPGMPCHIPSDNNRKDTKVEKYNASNIINIINTTTNADQNTALNITFNKIPIGHNNQTQIQQ